MFLKELLNQNKHKLVKYNEGIVGHSYMSVFAYCSKYGGTFDGFKCYNDYYIDITAQKENT